MYSDEVARMLEQINVTLQALGEELRNIRHAIETMSNNTAR
ncbi:MAG TPA: hypothetical protein VM050_12495 [Patescibacteria group bacterium]|nr:hypothetical protein [Patescibacteria group bacterium]